MEPFSCGSRICFFGDSITHEGFWIRRVYEYYRKIGKIDCEMYNCGVAGNTAERGWQRVNETVLEERPTDVVMGFGMNDCCRELYDGRPVTNEVAKMRESAIQKCLQDLERLAILFQKKGIRVILCTPTPYDEWSLGEEFCYSGVMGALQKIGKGIKEIAEKYGMDVVDFNSEMPVKDFCEKGKRLIRQDRVHPNREGYEMMAQIFLRSQGIFVEGFGEYEELKRLAEKPYDEWENVRFKLEQRIKQMEFPIYEAFYQEKNRNVLEERIREELPNQENPFAVECFEVYLKEWHRMPDYYLALREHTRQNKKTMESV